MEGKDNLTQDELEMVLGKLVSNNPNNEELKQFNEILKKYSKNSSSVSGFLYHIKNNTNDKIRQVAAVLLKRKVDKHWVNMDKTEQANLTALVINLILSERNFLVLKAIGNVVIRVARINLINGEWNELLDFIFSDPQKYSNEQAHLFELNLYIISELVDACHFYLKAKLPEIKTIMLLALTQGSHKMKENSTKILGNLVKSLEQVELNAFAEVIPCIFKEIQNFSEETVLHIYETFCDFHKTSLIFFEPYFDHILPLTIKFLQSDEFNGNTKLVLSEFLLMLGECKKKIFTKNGCEFLKLVINIGYKLASSDDAEEPDHDVDDLSGIFNKVNLFRFQNWNKNSRNFLSSDIFQIYFPSLFGCHHKASRLT